MLCAAIYDKDIKEILGQLLRIPTGFIGSVIGVVPTGNSGHSNISPLKSMSIPNDLQKIIDNSQTLLNK